MAVRGALCLPLQAGQQITEWQRLPRSVAEYNASMKVVNLTCRNDNLKIAAAEQNFYHLAVLGGQAAVVHPDAA